MVLVNNPGDWGNLYSQLEHAPWNGWTFTDWIFPFFLFIGGVSMAFSLGRLAEAGANKPALLAKLARRALLIFLVGLALNIIPNFNFATVRIPGVLQRIALCTLPGFGAGVLEPGKDFGAWIDRMLLDGHLWSRSKTWDPEGVFSTLPAICSQLLGVLCGRWLLGRSNQAEKTAWMAMAGLLLLWLGAMLDVVLMPINKSLWTPSFCLFTSGWALLLFSAFYWLLDANPHAAVRAAAARWSRPFIIYGMNALFIFALSGLVAKMLGFIKIDQPDGTRRSLGAVLYAPVRALDIAPVNTSLLYALIFNAAMFAVAYFMWRKKWFVKV